MILTLYERRADMLRIRIAFDAILARARANCGAVAALAFRRFPMVTILSRVRYAESTCLSPGVSAGVRDLTGAARHHGPEVANLWPELFQEVWTA